MTVASRKIRSRMLMTTAVAALAAMPGAAHAQLVRSTDLSSAVDSAGNPNQLTVTDTSATQTDIEVEAAVVVAEWTDFNIDMGDTVNVTIDAGLGLSEATLFNRVIGGNPSNMNGTLNAAGINFWLVNQNGILFGTDSTISAQSFFASTLDVANQDVFDFYEATDVFGNGTDTLNFVGATTNAVQALGNASFVTDGSLAFVGQQLDLTGSFDAGTGRAIFVTASDVDVSFTAGSPLTYTVNAGTTVAAQSIDGTVEGASAEFAMFTAAGVVGALLDIDATVTATTAMATDTGIALLASGPSTVTVEIGGGFSSTGQVVLNSNGDLTATANISGSDLDLDATSAVGALDLTATAGDVNVLAGTDITAGAVSATGGDVTLSAAGNITTTSINSTLSGAGGAIDVDSTGGGTLDLGTLTGDGAATLDTTGTLTLSTVNVGGVLDIGSTNLPATLNLNGNITAGSFAFTTANPFVSQDITTTTGDINIDAASITSGALDASAAGAVILTSPGNVTTTSIAANGIIDVDSSGGGTLDLGSLNGGAAATLDTTGTLTLGTVDVTGALDIGSTNLPVTLNLNGNIVAGSFAYTTASPFISQDITTTAGDINIDAASIATGALDASAAGAVILTAPGNVTTTSIAANGDIDVDSTGGGALNLGALTNGGNTTLDTTGSVDTDAITTTGNLTIGGTATPSTVTFGGNVSATMVDVTATGLVTALDVDATDGDLDINAGSILGANLTATGGDLTLNASGAISTTSLTATRVMGNGGDVDIDSTGGGNLDLGDITADASVTLDTTGVLTYNNIDASNGQIDIGSTATPSAINATGNQTAVEFIINSLTDVNVNDLTATAGDIDIDAPNITAGHLSATGGDVLLTAPGNITTTSITSIEFGGMGGAIDVDSTLAGDLDLGDLTSDGLVTLDTLGSLTLGTVNAGGALQIGNLNMPTALNLTGNITAATFAFSTLNPFVAQDITTTDGPLTINAGSILAGNLTTNGGDLTLNAIGAITTTSLTSNRVMGSGGSIDIDSTGGGNLNLGDITADSGVTLDTTGVLTYNDFNAPNGLLDIGSTAMPSAIIVTGDQTALEFIINSLTDIVVNDLTATNGVIDLDAPNITAGHLSATGGDVLLTAPGNITTTSITSIEAGLVGGNIDVDSTLGGDLDLGVLDATGNIALDTTGALTLGDVMAGGDLLIGVVNQPSPITFNGNLTASSFTFNTLAPFVANDITATAGGIDIDAPTITAGALSATGGDVMLNAADDITTTSITANAVGMVGGNIDVDSTMSGDLNLGDLSADRDISLFTGGTLIANQVTAGGSVFANAGGLPPTALTFTGAVTGSDVTLLGFLGVNAQDVTATAGNVTITSNALDVDVGNVLATGGDVQIFGLVGVDTSSITATSVGNVGGAIIADTFNGGLSLGDLMADTTITLDARLSIFANEVTAAGALIVGSGVDVPTRVNFTGDVNAGSIGVEVGVDGLGNSFSAQSLTSTAGNIDIDADSISAGAVSATMGDVLLATVGDATTASISSVASGGMGGGIDLDSTGGGAFNLGILAADDAIAIDTTGSVTTAAVNAGGAFNVGSTATPQTISLTDNVTAASVDLLAAVSVSAQDITATADLIDIEANQQVLGALSATGNIALDGGTSISTGNLTADSDLSGAGDVLIGTTSAPVTLATGVISGAGVNATAGSATILDVSATNGTAALATTAGALSAGVVDAIGGDAVLSSAGDITTTSVTTAGGSIDVDSTGGGALNLGDLTSDTNIALDTSGTLNAGVVDATGALTVGQTALPSAVTFTGSVIAGSMEIDGAAAGTLDAQDVTANAGDIDIDIGSITATDVSATGNVALDGAGTISLTNATADSDTSGAGDLSIGSTTIPAQLTVSGTASGVNTALHGTTMNVTTATATGGDLTLSGDTLTLGTAQATNNVIADATTSITVDTITADSDTSGMGDVEVGLITRPNVLTINTAVTGVNITLEADTLNIVNGVSNNGNITLRGDTLDLTDIAATGGDVTLEATDNVTTTSVTATAAGMVGGSVDVDSTAGGALDLGDLTADAGVTLDTTGGITTGVVTAGGTVQVGGTALPSSVDFTGNVTAEGIDVDTAPTATVNALDLTSTAGAIDIDAGSIGAGVVSATGGDALLTSGAGGVTTTSITTTGGSIDVDSTGGGTLDLGDLTSDTNIALDTSGTLNAGTVNATGALSVGQTVMPSAITFTGNVVAGSMDVDGAAVGTLDAQDLTANAGDIDIDVGSIAATNVSATGNVALDGAGTIALTTVTADSDTGGTGDVVVGSTTAPSQLTVATTTGVNVSFQAGQISATDTTATGGDATLAASGDITTSTITATTVGMAGGNIDVDSTGGGALDLGTLAGDAAITLDTTGSISTDQVTAGGVLQVGGTALPDTATFNNDVTASAIDIDTAATGSVTGTNLTATAGDIDVDTGSFTADTVSATGNLLIDGMNAIAIGTATADSDGNLTGELAIGTTTAPDTLTISGASSGTAVTLRADTALTVDTVTSTATDVSIASGGSATTQDVTAAGAVDITAATTLSSGNVTAMGGHVVLSGNDVTALAVTATDDIFVDGAGSIDLQSATADSDGNLVGDLNLGTITAPASVAVASASSGANVTINSTGTVTTDALTATAGDITVDAVGDVTTADTIASGSVSIQSDAGLVTQIITANGGDVTLSATDIVSDAIQATGNLTIDGTDDVMLASAIADSDMNGTGDLAIGTTTPPANVTIAGASSGVNTTIVSAGALTADTVDATGGNASLTATTITANTVNAGGGDAILNATGNIATNAITAAGGNIDVDSTGGGALDLGDLTADAGIALDTTGDIAAGEVSADGALLIGDTASPASVSLTGNAMAGSVGINSVGGIDAQDITATVGAVDVVSSELNAGALSAADGITIDGAGPITLTSAAADSDGNDVGDLTIGATTAPSELTISGAVSGANITTFSDGTTALGDVSTTTSETNITSADATTIASVDTGELTILSGGLLTIGAIDASGVAVLESADVDLQGPVDVGGASLTLRSTPDTSVGVGSGTGDYQLDDAEVDLINTATLVIDAVDQEISIGEVTFTDQAGSDQMILATTGAGSLIRITGDISGAGASRLFRFGGDPTTGDMLAERITMDIEAATIDFSDSTLELFGEDIVFGNQALIDEVAGRDSGDLALNLVGDANSLLFNPLLAGGLGGQRVADPVYLRAGNISVSYGNSALFQNTAPPAEGGTIFTGIDLGDFGSGGILNLDARDDTNTFAFFGRINGLEGTAAALAGGNVILLGNDVRLPDSRVNGCVIGSGADCVTTIVGTTIISIPREAVELLTADAGLLVPFDPLVGTNNEGLFSDVATGEDEDCERDENGACIGS